MWTVAVVQEAGWSGPGGGQLGVEVTGGGGGPGAAGEECPPGDVTAPDSAEGHQGPGGWRQPHRRALCPSFSRTLTAINVISVTHQEYGRSLN